MINFLSLKIVLNEGEIINKNGIVNNKRKKRPVRLSIVKVFSFLLIHFAVNLSLPASFSLQFNKRLKCEKPYSFIKY